MKRKLTTKTLRHKEELRRYDLLARSSAELQHEMLRRAFQRTQGSLAAAQIAVVNLAAKAARQIAELDRQKRRMES